jgi:hypothetical protein
VSEIGEFMLDLVVFHHTVLSYDLFEQFSKFRNVPLSVAQGIQMPTLGVFRLTLNVE